MSVDLPVLELTPKTKRPPGERCCDPVVYPDVDRAQAIRLLCGRAAGDMLRARRQAPSSGEYADSSSCCGQPKYPNLPVPTGAAALAGDGGGQVELLLLSPFIKKGGGLSQETYNHFSLLATVEEVFGLSKLGYVGGSEVKPFSASLF